MAAQNALLPKKKRIRFAIPLYRKVYVVFQYDRQKFTDIYKRLQQLALKYDNLSIFYNVNPYEVLNLCYLRDKEGHLKSMGDEPHIFRYKVLQNLLVEIANILKSDYNISFTQDVIKYLFKRTGIMISIFDESLTSIFRPQAEILETSLKSIKERIIVHITLLRTLRADYDFEDTLKSPQFDPDFVGNDFDPSYSWDMAQDALKNGEIDVYSSYPIDKGIFVTPSQMEAASYSGTGKIYNKRVPLQDVAWIDPTQGQYAPVENKLYDYLTQPTKNDILNSFEQFRTNPELKELTLSNVRQDLKEISGSNDIHLLAGNSKGGMQHIFEKHPEDLELVADTLQNGNITKVVPGRKIFIESPDGRTIIQLDYFGEKKNWLLTGYKKEE